MLKINKKVEYALIALKFMTEKESGVLTSAREICQRFQTPFDTTAKVLQVMNNHGLLNSVKGIKGGYDIKVDLNQISYMDLVRMIEGPQYDCLCESAQGMCDLYQHCNIVTPIDRLNSKLNHMLENLKLAELLLSPAYNTPKEVHLSVGLEQQV